jgi:hypothetical protein
MPIGDLLRSKDVNDSAKAAVGVPRKSSKLRDHGDWTHDSRIEGVAGEVAARTVRQPNAEGRCISQTAVESFVELFRMKGVSEPSPTLLDPFEA